jgi:hypothetical protein
MSTATAIVLGSVVISTQLLLIALIMNRSRIERKEQAESEYKSRIAVGMDIIHAINSK